MASYDAHLQPKPLGARLVLDTRERGRGVVPHAAHLLHECLDLPQRRPTHPPTAAPAETHPKASTQQSQKVGPPHSRSLSAKGQRKVRVPALSAQCALAPTHGQPQQPARQAARGAPRAAAPRRLALRTPRRAAAVPRRASHDLPHTRRAALRRRAWRRRARARQTRAPRRLRAAATRASLGSGAPTLSRALARLRASPRRPPARSAPPVHRRHTRSDTAGATFGGRVGSQQRHRRSIQ